MVIGPQETVFADNSLRLTELSCSRWPAVHRQQELESEANSGSRAAGLTPLYPFCNYADGDG